MDHDLAALSQARVAFIEHRHINKLLEARPTIARALWRETLIDAAIFREWIVNLGTRSAASRMAHLIAELRERLTVVGDIHGQLPDLLHILDESGMPSATNKYVFNGDFVDRGPHGVEVICILLALNAAMPDWVVLNRGNHEDHAICCVYGFSASARRSTATT